MRLAAIALPLLAAGCGVLDSGSPAGSTVSYSLDPFVVPAGSEVFMCRYFPPSGDDLYIGEMHASLSQGSHHLVVFSIDTALGIPQLGQSPCNQLDTPLGADAVLYATQEAIGGYPLPDGIGVHLDARHGLYLQAHFINAGSADLSPQVEFGLTTIDKAKVKQIAGQFFLSNTSLNIPPGGATSQTRGCAAPRDMTVLASAGHMHRHGHAFDGFLDGAPIYHSDSWDSPVAKVYAAPGLSITKGQLVRWTCDYQNDTNDTIHYGNSGLTDEMCIFGGLYYPAPEGFENTWLCTDPQP